MSNTVPTPPPPPPPSSSRGGAGVPAGSGTGVGATSVTSGTTGGDNVQSGGGAVLDRGDQVQDNYEDLTVEELKDLIDERNEERDDEDHLTKSGKKEDLIERLREDDKRVAADPETPAKVTGVEVVQESRVGEGVVRTYSTGTDSPALKPFSGDPDYVNPADEEAVERYESQREALVEAQTREAPDGDRLLRDFDPDEGQEEDK